MVVAILQFELLIPGAVSLKDKRRVVASVKDRLHREHQVSVAEVALQDRPGAARLALALVASDTRYAAGVLDRITAKLRTLRDAELGDCTREFLVNPEGNVEPPAPAHDPALDLEMLRRASDVENAA
ncbi:MAG: hypothetical protein HBSAPP03_16710 [Phycisphaerae bacterium]|nr:MAG: hypothetical protein HBSAPP03_16710 [Phycisphaerae bacterium]